MTQPLQGLGHFDGQTHVLPLRVYYEDTDLSGLVYHANYLRYMERGRTECFRLLGISKMADLESAEPTAWAIRRADIDFRRPARLDDVLEVHTILTSVTGARMTATQQICCRAAVLVEGKVEACMISLTGRPRRIPAEIRALLLPLLYKD